MKRPASLVPTGAESRHWHEWHTDYDHDSPLRRRLEIVQRHIRTVLDEFRGSPLRVISLCAGEARDLLGAVANVERRDLAGRLVEIDPDLAAVARRGCEALGLDEIEVVVGDAGNASAYVGAAPADLVLMCGVFGNIDKTDIQRTISASASMCVSGGTAIWTRHRTEPDQTPTIRRWFTEAGFSEIAFDPVPRGPGSVGVARYAGQTQPLVDQKLFTFTRTAP